MDADASVLNFLYRNKRMPTKIAIIGGGASAVALCHELFLKIRDAVGIGNNSYDAKVEITVFEKGDKIGPGFAYSSPFDCHILHHPTDLMKAIVEHDSMNENSNQQKSYTQNDFPPRHEFGDYLSNFAEQTRTNAAKFGIAIEFLCRTEVVDVIAVDLSKFQIKTSSGEHVANFVVFCTGHLPSETFRELIGKKGYWHDPYCTKIEMTDFNTKENVVIISTRLTAQDFAMRLFLEENFQGNVVMISNHGLLNMVGPKEYPDYQLKHLTLEAAKKNPSLENLTSLFWKEISEFEGTDIQFETIYKSDKEIDALNWLKQQIRRSETQQKPWQPVLFATHTAMRQIFPLMNAADQAKYREKYFSLITTYVAAIPLETAKQIRDLIQEGRIYVRGGLKSISTNAANEFVLECDDGENIVTKQLINGTGAGCDVNDLPLYRNMGARGEIVPHPVGGLVINPNTFRIFNKDGEENSRIFAIGALSFGTLLHTTFIGTSVWQANIVAGIIISRLIA